MAPLFVYICHMASHTFYSDATLPLLSPITGAPLSPSLHTRLILALTEDPTATPPDILLAIVHSAASLSRLFLDFNEPAAVLRLHRLHRLTTTLADRLS